MRLLASPMLVRMVLLRQSVEGRFDIFAGRVLFDTQRRVQAAVLVAERRARAREPTCEVAHLYPPNHGKAIHTTSVFHNRSRNNAHLPRLEDSA